MMYKRRARALALQWRFLLLLKKQVQALARCCIANFDFFLLRLERTQKKNLSLERCTQGKGKLNRGEDRLCLRIRL